MKIFLLSTFSLKWVLPGRVSQPETMDILESLRGDQNTETGFRELKADANNKSTFDCSVNEIACPSFGIQLDNDFCWHS